MEFNDEQLAAINDMIAAKVEETTNDLTSQITSLKNQNDSLIGEKRTAAQKAQKAIDDAEREKLTTSGDLESYKQRVQTLEERLGERDGELKTIKFDQAILGAVGSRNIRPELREDLIDALKFRAAYNDGRTTVGGFTINEYLDDFLSTDRGRHYVPASGSSGSGAPGSTSTSRSPTMTKENFNMTEFLAKPKAERDTVADSIGMPHLKNL